MAKKRAEYVRMGNRDPRMLALCAQSIIDDLRHYCSTSNLRLVMLFKEN